jgi:hypothetical protein
MDINLMSQRPMIKNLTSPPMMRNGQILEGSKEIMRMFSFSEEYSSAIIDPNEKQELLPAADVLIQESTTTPKFNLNQDIYGLWEQYHDAADTELLNKKKEVGKEGGIHRRNIKMHKSDKQSLFCTETDEQNCWDMCEGKDKSKGKESIICGCGIY